MELLLYTIGHRIRYKFTLLRRYEAKIDHFQSPVIQRLSVHLEANFNLYATHRGIRYIQSLHKVCFFLYLRIHLKIYNKAV